MCTAFVKCKKKQRDIIYENDDTLTNFKSFIEGRIFVRLSLDHLIVDYPNIDFDVHIPKKRRRKKNK